MGSLAILFAGQGNQYPQIGLDWIKYDPRLIKYVNEISSIGGFNMMEIIESIDDTIHDTFYAQPAIVLQSVLAYKILTSETKIHPKAIAGFSLGEYSALNVSGVFDFHDTMMILFERAKAMQSCAKMNPGTMAAILGLDTLAIESICEDISNRVGTVVCANYNCPGQLVISGEIEAVNAACDACKVAGAKRSIVLNVSGAFHSPLMSEASKTLKDVLSGYKTLEPTCLLYSNVSGLPYQTSNILDYLPKHLVSPVRFESIIRNMMNQGITHFLEIGPKATLSAFVKKINPEAFTINLDKVSDLENVKGWLKIHGFIE
jgi:[acyl-carrier-protein] S-malonyltransferase